MVAAPIHAPTRVREIGLNLGIVQGRVEEAWAEFQAALSIPEDAGLSAGIGVGLRKPLMAPALEVLVRSRLGDHPSDRTAE